MMTLKIGSLMTFVLVSLPYVISSFEYSSTKDNIESCRNRDGYWSVKEYKKRTCAECYTYLFPQHRELLAHRTFLISVNGSHYPHLTILDPDIHNSSTKSKICVTLSDNECMRWTECCQSAEKCCQQQLKTKPVTQHQDTCPGTWDGFGCWSDTPAGRVVTESCPVFLEHAIPSIDAFKTCTENGSWYKDPNSSLEWTNYTTCFNVDDFRINIYISVACNVLSLIFLIPAVSIFFAYKSLRAQHRIRLHINLFISFISTAVIFIIWDIAVYYDRLNSPATESLMHRNTIGCKFIYVLTRYARSTNYLWMFCEGFYLHRLIVKAFEPPKSLLVFYTLGWVFPWIPVSIYSIAKGLNADESCWVRHFGAWEWLIYIPNLISLAMNLFFLFNILRILLTQLQAHPNEPSNYRRALRTISILIPLFGLQLLFIIYRPSSTQKGARVYGIIASIITNSQGFFVAVIFCFLNGEVQALLQKTSSGYHNPNRRGTKGSISIATRSFSLTGDASNRDFFFKDSSSSSSTATSRGHKKHSTSSSISGVSTSISSNSSKFGFDCFKRKNENYNMLMCYSSKSQKKSKCPPKLMETNLMPSTQT